MEESSETCQLMDDFSSPKQSCDLTGPKFGQNVRLLSVQQRLTNVEWHRNDATKNDKWNVT